MLILSWLLCPLPVPRPFLSLNVQESHLIPLSPFVSCWPHRPVLTQHEWGLKEGHSASSWSELREGIILEGVFHREQRAIWGQAFGYLSKVWRESFVGSWRECVSRGKNLCLDKLRGVKIMGCPTEYRGEVQPSNETYAPMVSVLHGTQRSWEKGFSLWGAMAFPII